MESSDTSDDYEIEECSEQIMVANVIGFEDRDDDIVYKMKVSSNASYYYCFKTFEDFQHFHKKIVSTYPELRWLIKFPETTWFWQSPSKTDLEKRSDTFNQFMEKLTSDPKYSKDPDLTFFIDKDLKELRDAVHFYRSQVHHLRLRKNRKESQKEELQQALESLKEVNKIYLDARTDYRNRERRNSKKVKRLFFHQKVVVAKRKKGDKSEEETSDTDEDVIEEDEVEVKRELEDV